MKKRKVKHSWESRKDGTKIAVLLTIILFLAQFVPNGWSTAQTLHSYWLYPIPVWIAICLAVYLLGRVFKIIIRFL